MANSAQKIGWIGMGRMGSAMAERLLKAGYDVSIWNRTRAKAEPLAAKGGKIVDKLSDLAGMDIVFSIVSTGPDLKEVYFGPNGLITGRNGKLPKIFVDCSTIAVEDSQEIREELKKLGADFVAAPISGNAKVIKAGRLSAVLSGADAAAKTVTPMMEAIAPQGVAYVGEGELARICKIAHNVMLGVVIENLIEITLLANKMGVPRHAFLAFMNNSVMGSMFTRLQVAGAGQSRLDHDLHAGAAAQGHGPRARARPRLGRADAGDGGRARGAAGAFRRRHAAEEPGRVHSEGLRRHDGDHGADVRHEAREREQERPDGAGKLSFADSLSRVRLPEAREGWLQTDPDFAERWHTASILLLCKSRGRWPDARLHGNEPERRGAAMEQIRTTCCIAGGGPAGMMLGFLLARAGVDVVVLEKHADFLRDFRGDTIHPSTLEVMHELGLLDEFLKLPHRRVERLGGIVGDTPVQIADFTHLPTRCKFIALMPQWDFLDFLADHGRALSDTTICACAPRSPA